MTWSTPIALMAFGEGSKQDALDDALAPLMKLAAAYRNQSDQDALAAYVIRQLHAAWAMGV